MDISVMFAPIMAMATVVKICVCAGIRAYSNGGSLDYTKSGNVKVLPKIKAYVNSNSLANILGFCDVVDNYSVTFDSRNDDYFVVHVTETEGMRFKRLANGLYGFDTSADKLEPLLPDTHTSFFSTVSKNKEYFSRQEIEGAEKARELQGQVGWPSDQQFKEALSGKGQAFINAPVTPDDVTRAAAIHGGMAEPLLMGKMTRTKVIEAVNRVIAIHKDRGFEIEYVFGDNEFEKLEGKIDAALETCSAGEHNPYIEREIRVVKERQRCYWHGSPFKQVPKLVIDEILVDIIKWLNHYVRKNGISKNMSPGTIVRGNGPVDMGTLKASFLNYCIVYRTMTNEKTPRAARAIALRPSNNQGGYYFMSLKTGNRIHGFKWTRLATTQEVIDRVHELAEQQHAEYLDEEDNESISDEDLYNDETEDGSSSYDSEESFEPLDDESDENWESEDEEDENEVEQANEFQNGNDDDNGIASDVEDDDEPNITIDPAVEEDAQSTNNMQSGEELRSDMENEDENNETQPEDDLQESRSEDTQQELRSEDFDSEPNRQSKRERRQPSDPLGNIGSTSGKSYGNGFQFMNLKKPLTHTTTRQMNSTVVNHMFDEMCFNQMHASKGIELFKECAVAALFKEYKQLNDMAVVGRVKYEDLTDEDKKCALRAINLIKEKRDGKIKGRTCADGSKHRKFVPREDASSATLAVESLMALLVVFAHEKRDVAVFNVPGAYLHADLPPDKFVLLKIEGQFVDIMVDVNPEFKEDVRYENGKKVLYVQILKALYGMIESALLWYELYLTVLKEEGFEINKIDKCIAQKYIDGKPCTISWYVDDNIVGHMKEDVITGLLSRIEEEFPGLTIQRGKKLDFLGINLEFRDNGKLLMDTIEYLLGMVKDFEEEIGKTLNRTYSTPGSNWLFKVREDSPKLSQDKADMMLKYVMKVAWAMKRTRLDLESTNSFLMTRVHEPNKDDWHKLMRLMSFIKTTLNDKRVIGADSLHKMLTMVDSAHAVHRDMQGHTGGLISFGTGLVDTKSTKQKMNTRSSTKTEHVGTSEYMPKNIYFEMLMGELGYKLKNYIAKDNESEIKLLKNGRDLCTWNSKHIVIKYFWVTNRIKNGDIEVVYCPTEEMLADFMSKPVQESLFKNFRAALMGWTHMSELYHKYNDLEERVGNRENDDDKVDDSVTSQASRIAESKRSTYAEAVKKHNVRFMKGINEQSSLKRNNPFLKHLHRLIYTTTLQRFNSIFVVSHESFSNEFNDNVLDPSFQKNLQTIT
ncbi:hypothetical protein CTEN210_13083 [Chaetoceros tenuissimus]|uniref:Reverse transcriptase Ty1/copia-type domain-containing protein n=1 Tax=Chaetoceros tenuissimus TaxID=426638 RepID=A0AAD3D2C9_9STRA|nr:hypothetical protein CTEN210_13083 [Chaetoceros tenuissimus]